MIDVYAIVRHPTPPLPAPLHLVADGDLALAVAPACDDEVTPESLWRHEEVVEALMEDRDVLPVRFGTRLGGDAEARQIISERRDEFLRTLTLLAGGVELSVRAVAPCDDDAAEAVHEQLDGLARDSRRRPPHGAEALRAAYLVDRGAIERFTGCVAALQRRHSRLQLLCTGPWPPYTFAQP